MKLGVTKMSRFNMKSLPDDINKFYNNMFVPN